MKNWIGVSLGLAAATVSVGSAWGLDRVKGYLPTAEIDVSRVLEPAPRPGDPRYETDREIFRATRVLIGTPRWDLAANDAKLDSASLLRDYSCAVGISLTPRNAPRLLHVLQRASSDTARETNEAKNIYQRRRPYTIDEGEICQSQSELYDTKAGRVSYDYPSGHTTRGWTYALVLSSVAPDRAQQILERGRAFGDSRFVCGAHNESAVEAGMLSATATMAAVAAKPAYRADLSAARAELAALRRTGTPPQGCAAEANLVGQRVMPKLAGER